MYEGVRVFCSTMQACQFCPFWLTGCTLHATTNNNWLSLPATLWHKPLKIKYIIIPWEDRYHGGSFKPFDMVCTNRLQLMGGVQQSLAARKKDYSPGIAGSNGAFILSILLDYPIITQTPLSFNF